jgi:hypothetical protein
VHRWNQIAIDATGLDHTPVAPGEHRTFGEQLGPGRASRAMAIVHIAIFDTINAILGGYQSYTGIDSAPHPVSTIAAVAQAAHDTLVSLFPSQKAAFDQDLAEDLLRANSDKQKSNGIAFGKQMRPRYSPLAFRWLGSRKFISATFILQATCLVTGDRIRSASARSLWARIGVNADRS